MAKKKKTDPLLLNHRFFPKLLAFRAVLTFAALYLILARSFSQGLVSVIILAGVLSIGETIYAGLVYSDIAQARRAAQRAAKLAEIQQRERMKEIFASAQRDATEKYMEVPGYYASAAQKGG